jgi:hypothetical protein
MNRYSVFTHSYFSPVAVKHGFSWPSFLLGPVWALYVGCWRALAVYAVIIVAHVDAFPQWMSYLLAQDKGAGWLVQSGHLVCLVALSAWLSTFMNAWLAKSLLSKRYVEADVVTAMDEQHAIGLSSLIRPFPLHLSSC